MQEVCELIKNGHFINPAKIPENSIGYLDAYNYIKAAKGQDLIEVMEAFKKFQAEFKFRSRAFSKRQKYSALGVPAVPIKLTVDSFGNIPVHKVIPEVLRLYELPRDEYDGLCKAPESIVPITFDYSTEPSIYKTEHSI